MYLREMLEKVKSGELSVDEAERRIGLETYADMGYAKLDTAREKRTGFPEVVYCAGKPDEYIVSIYEKLLEADGRVFGTRATKEQFELVKQRIPDVEYDPISRILKVSHIEIERKGCVAVCCAGTADIPVAEEAAQTAEYFGTNVERVFDVGVSGIHRLLSKTEVLQRQRLRHIRKK